jgi:hypothetical protein
MMDQVASNAGKLREMMHQTAASCIKCIKSAINASNQQLMQQMMHRMQPNCIKSAINAANDASNCSHQLHQTA